MQVMAFDEASKDAFSEDGFEFRMLIMHYASLMNACALIDIRRDDDLECPLTLNREDPYFFRPNANPALLASNAGSNGGRASFASSHASVAVAPGDEAASPDGASASPEGSFKPRKRGRPRVGGPGA